MHERTTGLILRTHPLTETSLIVHWLTRDFGRLPTVAKGARRPKSPFHGKLDLFYLADLCFVRSRRSELHLLSEANLLETHTALRKNLAHLQQAAYCATLIEQTTETDTPLPGTLELMRGLLDYLPKQPPQAHAIFAFEMKLLNLLGLQPDFRKSKLSGGAEQVLEKLVGMDWQTLPRLRLAAAQIKEIGQFLHGFLIYHVGKVPAGRAKALNPASLNAVAAPRKSAV
jgi:DNA repair protein RecO (recombination protein O)